MDRSTDAGPAANEFVTLVIRHQVRSEHSRNYEAWLKKIMPIAQGFQGHLGVNVIRPASEGGTYTTILRFDNADHLEAWVKSQQRRQLIAEVEPLLEAPDHVEVASGATFWFTPEIPGVRKPAQWKQAVLTLAVIFPLTKIVPALWAPVFAWVPGFEKSLAGDFLVTATLVCLVVYAIMPRLTHWLSGWLKR